MLPWGDIDCAKVEQVGIGVVVVEFEHFGDKPAARPTLDLDDDIKRLRNVCLDGAKVSPETTIATSESPRAMVLGNACCSTLTAFSQGELPVCANAGAARHRATSEERTARVERSQE